MQKLFLFQILVVVFGIALLWAFSFDQRAMLSFAVGAGIVAFNMFTHTWVWKKIIAKKFVALAVISIVLKYAFIAALLYTYSSHLEANWILLGLSSILLTGLASGFLKGSIMEGEKEPI